MNTKNLNKHLFEKYGLNLTNVGLEEIVKIVVEENRDPLVCKGKLKECSNNVGEIFTFV